MFFRRFVSSASRTTPSSLDKIINFNKQIPGQTVYLTHVKWVTGKKQLERYFGQYGPINSINMFYDAETGLHRGFASVTFSHHRSAELAMSKRPHVIDGDRVDVEPYIPLISKKKHVTL